MQVKSSNLVATVVVVLLSKAGPVQAKEAEQQAKGLLLFSRLFGATNTTTIRFLGDTLPVVAKRTINLSQKSSPRTELAHGAR
jgi:hypothetical protein